MCENILRDILFNVITINCRFLPEWFMGDVFAAKRIRCDKPTDFIP